MTDLNKTVTPSSNDLAGYSSAPRRKKDLLPDLVERIALSRSLGNCIGLLAHVGSGLELRSHCLAVFAECCCYTRLSTPI